MFAFCSCKIHIILDHKRVNCYLFDKRDALTGKISGVSINWDTRSGGSSSLSNKSNFIFQEQDSIKKISSFLKLFFSLSVSSNFKSFKKLSFLLCSVLNHHFCCCWELPPLEEILCCRWPIKPVIKWKFLLSFLM